MADDGPPQITEVDEEDSADHRRAAAERDDSEPGPES